MPNGGTLLLIQNMFMQNEGNLFLIRGRFMTNGMNLFLIQKRLVQNGGNLFLNQKRPILLVRQGRIAYAPRVPDGRLYDLYEAAYKTYILMPLIQDSPNKRFGLSRYWTQKRPMKNRENLFLIRIGSMPNRGNLFSIQERLMPNGGTLLLIQEGSMQNRMNLFLTQKRPIQNEENGYGVKKWRLYLYRYPIWRTASSTAD